MRASEGGEQGLTASGKRSVPEKPLDVRKKVVGEEDERCRQAASKIWWSRRAFASTDRVCDREFRGTGKAAERCRKSQRSDEFSDEAGSDEAEKGREDDGARRRTEEQWENENEAVLATT